MNNKNNDDDDSDNCDSTDSPNPKLKWTNSMTAPDDEQLCTDPPPPQIHDKVQT